MGGRTPEELKNEIIERAKRAKEIKEMRQEVPEEVMDVEEDEEAFYAEEITGEDEFVYDLETVRQEGFAAFVFDANPVNPYITEDEEDDSLLLLKETWEQGYAQAHQHTCMSYLMLHLKDFFTARTDDDADRALGRVEEAYEVFSEIISFEEMEEFIRLVENPEEYEDEKE